MWTWIWALEFETLALAIVGKELSSYFLIFVALEMVVVVEEEEVGLEH